MTAERENEYDTETPGLPRPMTGLWASLTPAQQHAALAYRGPEAMGVRERHEALVTELRRSIRDGEMRTVKVVRVGHGRPPHDPDSPVRRPCRPRARRLHPHRPRSPSCRGSRPG